ncbi:MAG: aldo/keto reductase [Acidobacteriota bacterium]|nr:MAG: aldo/keto reductase [Acidobacteriota bacterium]
MKKEQGRPVEVQTSRRDFMKTGVAGAVGAGIGRGSAALSASAAEKVTPPYNPRTHGAMPMRNLGKTGYKVGVFSLGGQATIEKPGTEEESMGIVNRAIDLGVNYIDTAAAYGGEDQWSQKYIGKVIKDRRDEVFLATKTHRRTYDESMRLLESSLQQLNTDHLDLWQLHNISRTEQLDQIFAKDGAIHALEKARSEGIVRFLGITGHADPFVLADGLKRFNFDTILMAVNAADRHHLSFVDHLLPLALEQQLGIIGMKIPARGRILSSWTPPPPDQQTWAGGNQSGTLVMKEALEYVLSLQVSTVIIGCDNVEQLEENVKIASEFTPLNEDQHGEIYAKTEPVKKQSLFFRKWEA